MKKYKMGIRTSLITASINLLLGIIKILSGVLGNSKAMLADGIHTISDLITTIVLIIGLKVSSKEADESHPYGHERYESIFTKILSIILILTGLYIAYNSLSSLIIGNLKEPKSIALKAAFISILVKEAMFWYTMRTAKIIKSTSMEADAWHHRSDALSSIGSFIGILGARLGIFFLDPLAGIMVSLLIIKVGIDLYVKCVRELVDESADEETILDIKKLTKSIDGVLGIKDIKTRVYVNKIFVDLEIYVDPYISVKEGHDIAEIVHDRLEDSFEEIKHCMVHIEPYKGVY